MFEETLNLTECAVGSAFPCAAVAVGVGHKVFVRQFFGQRQVHPTALEITQDTLFDLASLSKLVATSMIALKFIENGKMSLTDNIGVFLAYTGSYGHTGFTGTSFFADSETGLWGILLTNAVHYGRENRSDYFAIRRKFYDMMLTEYKILPEEG